MNESCMYQHGQISKTVLSKKGRMLKHANQDIYLKMLKYAKQFYIVYGKDHM